MVTNIIKSLCLGMISTIIFTFIFIYYGMNMSNSNHIPPYAWLIDDDIIMIFALMFLSLISCISYLILSGTKLDP
jgi:hypothetical protein